MRLKYKISIVFLFFILINTIVSVFLISNSSETLFRSFMFSDDAEKAKIYASIIHDYYEENKNLNDIHLFLLDLPKIITSGINTKIHGSDSSAQAPFYTDSIIQTLISGRIILADKNGRIIADTQNLLLNTIHPKSHLSHGIPVYYQGELVGTVLAGSMIDSALTGMAEHFLISLTNSLVIQTSILGIVGFFLVIAISSRITKPLAKLATLSKDLAKENELMPIEVKGNDELTDLTIAFNKMMSELKQMAVIKKQIIADSAHELRTPVTLIQGTLEGMLEGVFPITLASIKDVYEESLRLSRLIDSLRQLENIEAGKLNLQIDFVNIPEILNKAYLLFAPMAKAKNIIFEYELIEETITSIEGDRYYLEQLMYNVISNAIHYTKENGSVKIIYEKETEEEILLSVHDSGPGIPLQERTKIFERYYRIDKSRSSNSGGRGLGLAIALEAAKAHGGSISVDNSCLGGAVFMIIIKKQNFNILKDK